MSSPDAEQEFQDLKNQMVDEDPIVRGMAAIDLGTFALEHPPYKSQVIPLLQVALDDPDKDVRDSAQQSLEQIEGKVIPAGKQIFGFGYIPEEYRQQQQVDPKQQILSCVCCIVMIVSLVLMFTFVF